MDAKKTDTQNQEVISKSTSASEIQSLGTKPEVHSNLRKRALRQVAVNDSVRESPTPAHGSSSQMTVGINKRNEDVNSGGAFQCGICSARFHNMIQLTGHMDDHGKENLFQCNMCNDIFGKAELLSAHLEVHTNVVKAFKCGICNQGFVENAALLDHLKHKHEVLPFLYKCNICLLLFKEISKLISHVAKRHPPVCKEYRCGLCDKKFTQGNRLTLHVLKHSQTDKKQSKRSSKPTPTKTKINLNSHNKETAEETIGRKTRSNNIKQFSSSNPQSLNEREIKNKVKEKEKKRNISEIKEELNETSNYESEDDDKPLKSAKRGQKRYAATDYPLVEKKAAIKDNEELIATYKRIDPVSQSEVYDCDVCGQRFYECITFTEHRADHFYDDKYCIHCKSCKQVFDNFEDLSEHIDKGKCSGYVCSTCGKSFPLEPALLTHQVKNHASPKKIGNKFVCSTCEKTFDNRTAFLRHATSHSETKCIECKLCRHSFTTPETLFGHLRTTHSLIPLTRKKYKFKCKECDINFMKIEALRNHQSLVHKIEVDVPTAHQASTKSRKPKVKEKQVSDQPVKRTGHWRSVEDDKKRRTCHICNRVFRRYKDVRRHIGTHTKPYLCSHCGKAFPYRYSLDAHIKAFHSAENPFKCDICSKYFSCPRSLIVHQRIHTGERPHQCHVCNKRFRQVANLSMHLKLHNTEKPFKCPLCDYCCRHRGYLKRHMSTHSKEKKHFCPICNKGFTEKPNLNHHLKRHTKIKNHVCPICGNRFAERYYLNNHMRIHTKEKPYVCPVCERAFTMRPNMVSHIKKTHPSYNYQPIRPSHHPTSVAAVNNNTNASMQKSSLPPIGHNLILTSSSSPASVIPPSHQIPVSKQAPPLPLPQTAPPIPQPLPLSLPQVPPNIAPPSQQSLPPQQPPSQSQQLPPSPPPRLPPQPPLSLSQLPQNMPIYHSNEAPLSKVDNHMYPSNDSLIQTQVLRDQQHQLIMREPQIINDSMIVRNQLVIRETMMDDSIHLDDPDRRHYGNLANRLSVSDQGGYENQREVTNPNFPLVMPGQDFMYTYSNLSDSFIQGFFPLTNQHNQQPQPKP